MIEKNVNIIHDSSIKRIVEYSEDSKQINILDNRYYRRNGKFYPSVTSVLNYFPKNKFFHDWLKEVGANSEFIAQKAAGEGTQVHNAINDLLNKKQIEWIDEFGKVKYQLDVWKMILKFSEFWNKFKPELVATEYHLFSDEHEYAGTADIICRLNGVLWLIDVKTSKSLHRTNDLQLAAYATAWNESHDEKIIETGILWLKAAIKKEGKGEQMQGKGWALKSIGDIETNLLIFKNIYSIYKLENPSMKPYSEILPTFVKLD